MVLITEALDLSGVAAGRIKIPPAQDLMTDNKESYVGVTRVEDSAHLLALVARGGYQVEADGEMELLVVQQLALGKRFRVGVLSLTKTWMRLLVVDPES